MSGCMTKRNARGMPKWSAKSTAIKCPSRRCSSSLANACQGGSLWSDLSGPDRRFSGAKNKVLRGPPSTNTSCRCCGGGRLRSAASPCNHPLAGLLVEEGSDIQGGTPLRMIDLNGEEPLALLRTVLGSLQPRGANLDR